MDTTRDEGAGHQDSPGLLHHAVRIALVIYTSPIILIVLAIGLVGLLAIGLRRTARAKSTGEKVSGTNGTRLSVTHSLVDF